MDKLKAVELTEEELAMADGGVYGGSKNPLPPKAGYIVYRIGSGENLTGIAKRHRTTVQKIMAANPTITDKNKIAAGFYIYIPQ